MGENNRKTISVLKPIWKRKVQKIGTKRRKLLPMNSEEASGRSYTHLRVQHMVNDNTKGKPER